MKKLVEMWNRHSIKDIDILVSLYDDSAVNHQVAESEVQEKAKYHSFTRLRAMRIRLNRKRSFIILGPIVEDTAPFLAVKYCHELTL